MLGPNEQSQIVEAIVQIQPTQQHKFRQLHSVHKQQYSMPICRPSCLSFHEQCSTFVFHVNHHQSNNGHQSPPQLHAYPHKDIRTIPRSMALHSSHQPDDTANGKEPMLFTYTHILHIFASCTQRTSQHNYMYHLQASSTH